MNKICLITLAIAAVGGLGCGLSPGARLWYHPQRTLEQAKQDIERCYDEAFLAEQGGWSSPDPANDTKEPLMYVEISARQCMKQSGYDRVSADELDHAAKKRTGVVHGVTYFIAGG